MNRRFLLFSILCAVALPFVPPFLHATDPKDHAELFRKAKGIALNASPKEYRKIAQRFRDEKTTVCECFTTLCNGRVDNRFESLKKDLPLTEKDYEIIGSIIKKLVEIDRKRYPVIQQSTPGLINDDLQGYIWKQFSLIKPPCNSQPKTTLFSQTTEAIRYRLKERGLYNYPITVQKSEKTGIGITIETLFNMPYPSDPKLYLNSEFFQLSKEAQKGAILHEIQGHAAHRDPEKSLLLKIVAGSYNKDFNTEFYKKFPSYLAWSKAQEQRADRIPAACMTLQEARYLETSFREQLDKENPIMRHPRVIEASRATKLSKQQSHPLLPNALQWQLAFVN